MNKNQKISIIMGIYNCEKTLSESIDSIINQSYENWELIMCDDCSNDNTYKVAKEYMDKYPKKIKLIKNEKNMTLGPTLNKCLKIASGAYIARQDGDDLSTKDRLLKQIKCLEENPQFDLVGTGMMIFDENGSYGERMLKEHPVGKDLMKGTTFAHATIMCKKSVYEILDGYSEEENRKGVEDYDLWFRFFEKGFNGYNIQESLYKVREDKEAYKRKNIGRRINEIKTMITGMKKLKLGLKSSVFILKPIVAILILSKVLMKYHRKN